MKSIVIFMQNRDFFGAKLVHIPLLHAIRKTYPKAHITLFTPYQANEMFRELGLADSLFTYGLSAFTVIRGLWKAKPDLILNIRPESGAISFALPFSRSARKISFDLDVAKRVHHDVVASSTSTYRALNYLRLLKPLNIEAQTEDFFRERWGFEHKPDAAHPKILLVVGAGTSEMKRWGIDNFLTLAEHLIRERPNLKIGFVWGEVERPYAAAIQDFERRFRSHIVELTPNSPPKEIVEQLKTTSLVIGCDAGPTHLAQLCHVPFLSIVTDENHQGKIVSAEWNRMDDRTDVILGAPGGDIKDIPVPKVLKRALEMLG